MSWGIKTVLTVTGVAVIFGTGFILGEKFGTRCIQFADIRVNHAREYTKLVDPDHPYVRKLAGHMKKPEDAYLFVRDRIKFEQWRPAQTPDVVLRERAGSCLGKAALLCSLYRAMGIPSDKAFVVTGQVFSEGGAVNHAWVHLQVEGRSLQQDPTRLLGNFSFDDFPGKKYSGSFIVQENFCFNDEGFAVVSQLNRRFHQLER